MVVSIIQKVRQGAHCVFPAGTDLAARQ